MTGGDWQAWVAWACGDVLACCLFGALLYWIGRGHGYDDGYAAGHATATRDALGMRSVPPRGNS